MIQRILPVTGVLAFLFLSGTVSEMSSVAANVKSNMIVLMGTLSCCMISYPFRVFSELFVSIRLAFTKEPKGFDHIIDEIEALSVIRRSKGLFELDKKSKEIENGFLKIGIEMVADGYDRYTIFKTLERRYDSYLTARRSQTDLVGTMVKLMPVFGFVGTIIGLINVLNHMGSPELIGQGVATALLTTFYGLLYANILFLPLGKKLSERIRRDSIELALIIEGVMDIADKVNSKSISYRLKYCVGEFSQDDHQLETKMAAPQKSLPSLKLAFKRAGRG